MKTIAFDFDNVGGLTHLYLIDVAGLERVDTNVSDGKVRPVIASGTRVYNIEVYAGNDFKFNETMSIEDSGNVFAVTIAGYIPRLDSLVDVDVLERGEWIAVHQDANGNILLTGTRDVPLRFVTNKSSGSAAGRNATAFSLEASEPTASKVATSEALVLE